MKKVGCVVASYEVEGFRVYADVGSLLEYPRHDPTKGGLQYSAILRSWVNFQELARLQGKDGVMLNFYLDEATPFKPKAAKALAAVPDDRDDDIPF